MQKQVYYLITGFHSNITEATQCLKDLEAHFSDRKQILREDAMQLCEIRAQILSCLLVDISDHEESEAARLLRLRVAREKRINEEDEQRSAKVQGKSPAGKRKKSKQEAAR